MAATGIAVDDSVISTFNDFKLKKTSFKYFIYKIAKDASKKHQAVVTEKTGEKSSTYDAFLADLPAEEPRYALIGACGA